MYGVRLLLFWCVKFIFCLFISRQNNNLFRRHLQKEEENTISSFSILRIFTHLHSVFFFFWILNTVGFFRFAVCNTVRFLDRFVIVFFILPFRKYFTQEFHLNVLCVKFASFWWLFIYVANIKFYSIELVWNSFKNLCCYS